MKYILILLSFVSILCCTSCVKTVDVEHNIHDTLYLFQKIDTFRITTVRTDTVIKHDNHVDTVIQVRHDTLILTKTITDTLFKYYLDTVYLTKILHDTVTEIVYIHDTVNNIRVVTQHDTIIQTNTVVVVDTVYSYYSLGVNYPVPARDSGQIFITFDTVPGLTINNIQIINLQSYVPGSQTFQTPATYTQVSNYLPINYPLYGWMIHPVGPMICTIVFNYTWTVPNPVTITFQTFDHVHSWSAQTLNPTGGANGTTHTSQAVFSYIDLTQIFFMGIKNHY
jgi:hypothetical protein